MRVAFVLASATALALAACSSSSPVQCTADTDCDLIADGKCVAVAGGHRWCAHPDPNCLGAYRFSSYDVGDNLAGSCIDTTTLVCEAGAFQGCVGNDASFCNATGDSYQSRACALGCSATDGCRMCDANQTTCTGKTLSVCDAAGKATITECPLGCADGEARCKDIVPSNDLGQFLPMAATSPDLVLDDHDVLDEDGYVWRGGKKTDIHVPVRQLSAPAGGVPVRVYIVRSLVVGNVRLSGWIRDAVGFVSFADIVIRGRLDISGAGFPGPFDYFAPGSISSGAHDCLGRIGTVGTMAYSGNGGGGYATDGSAGGQVEGTREGAGGSSFENPDLVPLRGGCAGGGVLEGETEGPDGHGGGAIQLVSRTSILLEAGAVIDAGGAGGNMYSRAGGGAGGGGSGGGILLEAPKVRLENTAALVANGGGGGSSFEIGTSGLVSTSPASGGRSCSSRACTAGGSGGTGIVPPTGVAYLPATPSGSATGGGGGGAAGYIRINTPDRRYDIGNGVILSPTPSTGSLSAR